MFCIFYLVKIHINASFFSITCFITVHLSVVSGYFGMHVCVPLISASIVYCEAFAHAVQFLYPRLYLCVV